MASGVLLLAFAAAATTPAPSDIWRQVQRTYATMKTYRDSARARGHWGGSATVLEFNTVFSRARGLKLTGRELSPNGDARMTWVAWGDTRCARLYHVESRRIITCTEREPLPMIGYVQAAPTVVPSLLAGRPIYPEWDIEEMTLATPPGGNAYELTIRTRFRDLDTFVIDRSSFVVRRVEHRGITLHDPRIAILSYSVEYRNVQVNGPVTASDVSYRPGVLALAQNKLGATFALWCIGLAGLSFGLSVRQLKAAPDIDEREEKTRVSWRRLRVATVICFVVIAALFVLTSLPEKQGHPPAVVIPLLLVVPTAGIVLSSVSWLIGRELALRAARSRASG